MPTKNPNQITNPFFCLFSNLVMAVASFRWRLPLEASSPWARRRST